MRTSRSNGSTTYHYVYNGSQLTQMCIVNSAGTQTVDIAYDAAGTPLSLTHCDTDGDVATYYYITNIQGDVIGMTNTSGNLLIAFHYDAYGTAVYTTHDSTLAPVLAQINPLGYRGYVMDSGTGLYYLQSRYYDTAWGRFINADALVITGQGLLGNNMFAYCLNNPIMFCDPNGTSGHNAVQPWMCDCSGCKTDHMLLICSAGLLYPDSYAGQVGANMGTEIANWIMGIGYNGDERGIVTIGITGSFMSGGGGSVAYGITFDPNGNIGIIQTWGVGGGFPYCGASGFISISSAQDIFQQEGDGFVTGLSGNCSPYSLGAEYQLFKDPITGEVFHGGTLLFGVASPTIPVEWHGEYTNSEILWSWNIREWWKGL